MLERPHGGYRCIYGDPAWRYKMRSAKGEAKSPQSHYRTMTDAELMAAAPAIERLAARDAVFFMWAVFPKLPFALELLKGCGFTYKTGGAWAKQSTTGRAWAFGTGYILRSAAEILLVGTRGSPTWTSKSVRNLWVAPLREHSRKPDAVIEDIERLTIGPRLELFSRTERPGWDYALSDELGKFGDGGAAPPPQGDRPGPGGRDWRGAKDSRPNHDAQSLTHSPSTEEPQAIRRRRRRGALTAWPVRAD